MVGQGVAVLVDGENVSSRHAAHVLRIAEGLGPIRVARVYGHVQQLNGWAESAGYVLIHSRRGKDAADLVLAIQAVSLPMAFLDPVDAC